MMVVSDTTPLSSLIQLDRLFLLKILFNKILIPKEVAEELYKNSFLKSVVNQNISWIEICSFKDNTIQNKLMAVLDKVKAPQFLLPWKEMPILF